MVAVSLGRDESSRDVIARLLLRMQDMGTTGGGTGEELPDDHWRGILLQLLSRLQDVHDGSRAPAVAVAEVLVEQATSCIGGCVVEGAAKCAANELELVSCMRASEAQAHARVSEAQTRASETEAQAYARASEAQSRASAAEAQAQARASASQTRAAEVEAQAQARVSEALTRATEAEAQARARVAEAETTAAEEIHRLEAHVQAAEAAAEFASARAHLRVSEADAAIRAAEVRSLVHLADLEAETEAITGGNSKRVADIATSPLGKEHRPEWRDTWTGLIDDLPQGLLQHMLRAETALDGVSSDVGGAGAAPAVSALRRARRAYDELHSEPSGGEERLHGIVRWCTLLAVALDSMLEFWYPPTQVPPLPGARSQTKPLLAQGARLGDSGEARDAHSVAQHPSAREMQEVQREVEELLEESCGSQTAIERLGASASHAALQRLKMPSPMVLLPVVAQQQKQQSQQQQLRCSSSVGSFTAAPVVAPGSTAALEADEEEEDGQVPCLDAFRADSPEAELSLTIAEVQRSAALDQIRLNEELRTLSLQHGLMQQQLEQSGHAVPLSRVQQPHSLARRGQLLPGSAESWQPLLQPRGRSQTPSPRRLSRQPSFQPRSPSAEPPRSPAPMSPALQAHLRGSSPAMRVAAQRWGRPQELASSVNHGLNSSTTSLLLCGNGIGCGSAGLRVSNSNRCARHSPVRARHSLLQR